MYKQRCTKALCAKGMCSKGVQKPRGLKGCAATDLQNGLCTKPMSLVNIIVAVASQASGRSMQSYVRASLASSRLSLQAHGLLGTTHAIHLLLLCRVCLRRLYRVLSGIIRLVFSVCFFR